MKAKRLLYHILTILIAGAALFGHAAPAARLPIVRPTTLPVARPITLPVVCPITLPTILLEDDLPILLEDDLPIIPLGDDLPIIPLGDALPTIEYFMKDCEESPIAPWPTFFKGDYLLSPITPVIYTGRGSSSDFRSKDEKRKQDDYDEQNNQYSRPHDSKNESHHHSHHHDSIQCEETLQIKDLIYESDVRFIIPQDRTVHSDNPSSCLIVEREIIVHIAKKAILLKDIHHKIRGLLHKNLFLPNDTTKCEGKNTTHIQ